MTQRKYKALKNHICRFNDGECICKCFDKGYKNAIKKVISIIRYEQGGLDGNQTQLNPDILVEDIRNLLTTHNK